MEPEMSGSIEICRRLCFFEVIGGAGMLMIVSANNAALSVITLWTTNITALSAASRLLTVRYPGLFQSRG